MSSIHLLGSIINGMENELIKYSKKEGVNEGVVKQKQKLIQQLSDIYDSYKHITMWEVFEVINKDVDKLLAKDKELSHVIIVLPLYPVKFNASHCGFIDYSERDGVVIESKPDTYLDEDYYKPPY